MSNLYFYCLCGAKTPNTGVAPKFCSSCGQSFLAADKRPAVVTKPVKQTAATIPVSPKKKKNALDQKLERIRELQRLAELEEDDDIDTDDEDEDFEITDDDDDGLDNVVTNLDPDDNLFEVDVSGPKQLTIRDIAASKEVAPIDNQSPRAKKQSKKEFQEELKREAGTLRPKN